MQADLKAARDQVGQLQSAKISADALAKEASDKLASEQKLREAAEKALADARKQ